MFVKKILGKIFTKKLPTNIESPVTEFIKKNGCTEVNLAELLANNIKNNKNSL